jgi:hypothetical protein
MQRRLYTIDRLLGGILNGELTAYGSALLTTPQERLIHDLLLAGARALVRSFERADRRKRKAGKSELDSLLFEE